MKAQKQGATAQETELARVSRETWADYTSRYAPAEAELIRRAEFTEGEEARVKGEVSADTAAAFKDVNRNSIAANAAAGAKVGSGKAKLSMAADAYAAGTTTGVGQSIAKTGGELDAQGQRLGITATGRGIAREATANLSRGAQRATSLALAASQARFERNAAILDGVASVAGAATRKYQLASKKKAHEKFADGLLVDVDNMPGYRATNSMVDPMDFQTSGFSNA